MDFRGEPEAGRTRREGRQLEKKRINAKIERFAKASFAIVMLLINFPLLNK
jgi:hypothetical protein